MCTIDPARRLAQSMGLEQLGGDPKLVPVTAGRSKPKGELWAMMLDMKSTFDQMVLEMTTEERAQKIVAEQGSMAFDLGHAPLLRGVLLRMGEREHVFGLTLHHILCDEWSLGLLMEELAEAYEQCEKGEEPPLPQLATQCLPSVGSYQRNVSVPAPVFPGLR